ncbi:PIG-L deacetylase family protein [Pelosinus sp. UFO1]|uniref:PIG-L deacetylase family protein n=1 Tax=Pelosinus sp. UFO1 TaxID=484770 RepID=UPI00068F3BA2|nr:PIG-L family deacetylase [Pelosinus sp. UFO1]
MRHIYKILYVIVGVSIILYFISSLYFYYQEKPEANVLLQSLPVVQKQTRLLVIAPHCDDETLGCAGVIHDVIAAGGQVMVVFMTNGDGFTVATEEQFHRLFLTNEDYVNSGYARQSETLHALHLLGVPEKQIIFLGFPDRGLRAIWSDYWNNSQPYQSRYTGSDHSPYTTSYQQNAPYTGETVLNNLEQIMLAFQPNLILAPHPADEHPDHASTWAFVAAAFMKLSKGEFVPGVNLYTYLIHRGDFPIPHGYKTDALLSPPKPLYQTQPSSWLQYPINSDMEALKEQSIKEYVSQIRVPIMSSLLYSFIRKNELFEEVHFPLITQIPLDVDLRNLDTWSNQEPILVNPRGVNPVGALEPKGKITSIYSYMQGNTIWIRFHIPGFSKKRNQYDVSIVTFSLSDHQMSREKQTVYFSKADTNLSPDDIVRYPDDVIIKISSSPTQLKNFLFIRVETKNQFGIMFNHTVWQPAFLSKF